MKTCPQCSASYDDEYEACPHDGAPLVQYVPPADPLLGKMLAGRYRLVEKIGQGGMGAIYKAVHTRMDRICAIKLLTGLSSDNEGAIVRFNREAKMASRIDNPHAVTIYDFGEADAGTLYLAMEFIDGSPLSHVMAQEKQLELGRAVNITRQIAEALTAAHALGIIHRDLKPDNIMITKKGAEAEFVKVLDFGIAKAVADEASDNVTKTGFILGTPVYMSPEQLSGEKLDPRSDIYSLAIIVYEMLSGRLPFEGENTQAIMIKRLMSDPIALDVARPSISETVRAVVMAGLSRDREGRPAQVGLFAAQLEAALNSGTRVLSSRVTGVIAEESGGRQTVAWSSVPTAPEETTEEASNAGSTLLLSSSALRAPTLPQPGAAEALTSPVSNATTGVKETARSEETLKRVPDTSVYAAPATIPDLAIVQPTRLVRRVSRRVVVGAVAVALVALTAVYIFALRSDSGFTLLVTGAPPGSEVFVNNVRRGVTSAQGVERIEGIGAGNAEVRISRDGFGDFSATVIGSSGEERVVKASLLPGRVDFGGSMILVPAGEFIMGDDSHELDERPAHSISLEAFYIDEFEVTNEQYRRFCDATGRAYPPNPRSGQNYFTDNPRAPVMSVGFDDASAYARWANKRLPTEEEWEKAASWDPVAKKKRQWPWGDSPEKSLANLGADAAVPVDRFSSDVSAYGVHGLAGNAAEWVHAFYQPYTGNEMGDPNFGEKYRVVRGGAYGAGIEDARTTHREYLDPLSKGRASPVGFRCAVSASDPSIQALIQRPR